MPDVTDARDSTLPPQPLPPLKPRPRLFAALLVAFAGWAAFLLWLNVYGSG